MIETDKTIRPDATFFVDRLHRAVDAIRPWVTRSIKTQVDFDSHFAGSLREWSVKQGIANYGDDLFYALVGSQIAYRFIGKIIFYETLRKWRPSLLELDLSNVDDSLVLHQLRMMFEEARKIDYQAIFEEEIIDQVPFPQAAVGEIKTLVQDLNRYSFHDVPQDVIGQVYERLIPPEERHTLGQYFTREDLVDVILSLCVRDAKDMVLDPTCGSGTFLVRAYSLLKSFDKRTHSMLLNQLWGVDIAKFPAQLATINLFRQKLDDASNFPRIVPRDFFTIKPGMEIEFPSPVGDAAGSVTWVKEQCPCFDAIVGNFPYIRQEAIEKQVHGYKYVLQKTLAEDWYAGGEYRGLFDRRGKLKLSGLADIYAYLFIHASKLLKPGARIGIITSNAWLDVNYGFELQRFLLNNFKIIAILESRCEPWFDQVSMNTIVTIAERCSDAETRNRNSVAFIKVKRPLAQMSSQKTKIADYWKENRENLNAALNYSAAQAIEGNNSFTQYESDVFRTRFAPQEKLLSQIEQFGKTVKWGPYLRAPQIYFELANNMPKKLALLKEIAPPARGCLTELNQFFYLDPKRLQKWQIESEYLLPLIKSPGGTGTIKIDPKELPMKVFVCRNTLEEIKAKKKNGALRYIEWGGQQVYDRGTHASLKWCENPWIKDRKPGWWAVPTYRTRLGQIFLIRAYGDRFVVRFSQVPLIADTRLFFLSPYSQDKIELIAAVMNSTIVAFFMEVIGRVTLGDGALEVSVEDTRDYLLIPDVRQFKPEDTQAVISAFKTLLERPIESIFKEIQKKDRQELDRAVLKAIKLDPDKYLNRIYEGLCQLVRERLGLATQRKKAQKVRPQRDLKNAKQSVIEEILPAGPKRFPSDFVNYDLIGDKFEELVLPTEILKVGHQFFGVQEVTADSGFKRKVKTPPEAKFILYAQKSGSLAIRLPLDPLEQFKAVSSYEVYLRDLHKKLTGALRSRTMNYKIADRLFDELWQENNLPPFPEGT